MKEASTSLTLLSPLILFRQIESSSFDSGWQATQCFGGFRKRPHALQHCIGTLFGIPSVISTRVLMQFAHILAGFHTIGAPQVQQRMVACVPGISAEAPERASASASKLLASPPGICICVIPCNKMNVEEAIKQNNTVVREERMVTFNARAQFSTSGQMCRAAAATQADPQLDSKFKSLSSLRPTDQKKCCCKED